MEDMNTKVELAAHATPTDDDVQMQLDYDRVRLPCWRENLAVVERKLVEAWAVRRFVESERFRGAVPQDWLRPGGEQEVKDRQQGIQAEMCEHISTLNWAREALARRIALTERGIPTE